MRKESNLGTYLHLSQLKQLFKIPAYTQRTNPVTITLHDTLPMGNPYFTDIEWALELDPLACTFHYSYVHPRKMCAMHNMELMVLQL